MVNSLDRLLCVLNKENLVSHFPGIGNQITTDVISVLSYLHKKSILHREIKPSNVIVNNLQYSLCWESELEEKFSK